MKTEVSDRRGFWGQYLFLSMVATPLALLFVMMFGWAIGRNSVAAFTTHGKAQWVIGTVIGLVFAAPAMAGGAKALMVGVRMTLMVAGTFLAVGIFGAIIRSSSHPGFLRAIIDTAFYSAAAFIAGYLGTMAWSQLQASRTSDTR